MNKSSFDNIQAVRTIETILTVGVLRPMIVGKFWAGPPVQFLPRAATR